jgi:hydroxymethylglutaryl-CoA synthase
MTKKTNTGTYGVSGIKLYVPPLRVRLEDWCAWTGNPWNKIRSVVGRSFRVRGPNESIYTMAANAVLRLILDYDVDPTRVGFLGFGTESSTDNSAGAVILKGMVDRALAQMGRPRLSRHCEVPEFKHACLGGVYALKGAARYLALDGRSRQAIVVCADIAEYERGSTGEQTQGSGAVALLLEENPALYTMDLSRTGSASDYRGPDFRKPHRRHVMEGYAGAGAGIHDYPVFSGKYSTTCYVDETLRAIEDLLDGQVLSPRSFYHQVEGLFFHRPYHQMPLNAMAAMYLWGLVKSPDHHPELQEVCRAAGADWSAMLEEMRSRPDLFAQVLAGKAGEEIYPESMKAAKVFRATPKFQEIVATKMALGSDRMMDIGNLYTASLPAWIAAGLEEAAEAGRDLGGKEFLTVGYGSGDAAEAMMIQIPTGYEEAAAKIGFRRALAEPVDLSQEQYEALHDGRDFPGKLPPASNVFVVERVGESARGELQDVGIEYYRYA